MTEDIQLFQKIVKLDEIRDCHWIVIFNKYDLFKKSVYDLEISFKSYFNDYKGKDGDHKEIIQYIIEKLLDSDCNRPYIHFFVTNAVNTACMTSVFGYIHHNILKFKSQ